jgi:ribosome-binding protein aMBF1 (putative translation factor)
MRCAICKKEGNEIKLFEGILNTGMINICSRCSEEGGIPIIRKPSKEQLKKGEERYSVRERMERMSGMRDSSEISGEQTIIQKNLSRLKIPEKKETNEGVLDDYYWTLNMARRRKKWSINQLSEKIKIDSKIIKDIERGRIPKNFEEIFIKFEIFFGIKLLKNHKNKIHFKRTINEEREILDSVREKMNFPQKEETKVEEKILEDEIDFNSKESLENLTLNDLVNMKRKKEKKAKQKKIKIQTASMVGDDIDLEIGEL